MANLNSVRKDLRILVVDDYALTRAMVQSILKSVGFTSIVEAENGANAIRKLDEERIELVICDWNMPEVTGVDVLRHLRAQAHYAKTPFVMLTAEGYRKNVVEAAEAGVTEYIVKPFTADVLIEKLGRVLGDRS